MTHLQLLVTAWWTNQQESFCPEDLTVYAVAMQKWHIIGGGRCWVGLFTGFCVFLYFTWFTVELRLRDLRDLKVHGQTDLMYSSPDFRKSGEEPQISRAFVSSSNPRDFFPDEIFLCFLIFLTSSYFPLACIASTNKIFSLEAAFLLPYFDKEVLSTSM